MSKAASPNYEAAHSYALELLDTELPPGLSYHGPHHTRDQVLPTAILFCEDMTISPKEQLLVKTAALFHDIGFTQQYADNEEISAAMVGTILPSFAYSAQDIRTIKGLIRATKMPQQPESVLEQILCDADLASLGQDIFFETSMMLRRETAKFGTRVLLRDWFTDQYTFLASHHYFTAAARKRLNATKEQNLSELLLLLEAPKPSQYKL